MPSSSPEVIAVQKLAAKMKYKMRRRKHSHTNHWHDMQLEDLMACVNMEVHELAMALIELRRERAYHCRGIPGDKDKHVERARRHVISECADVANYCAFIVDNLTGGGKA